MNPAHRVLQRYSADRLTKEWVMGVRRGWLKLMAPSINDWDDVQQAYKNLELFVRRLADQIYYARRGPDTGSSDSGDGKKVAALLNKLGEVIDDLKGKARHWQEVQENRSMPGSRQEDGERMLALYRKDFPEASTFSLESSSGKWRNASMTELMDKILKLLREDAQRIKDHDEKHPETPYEDRSAFKEFDLYGMKVVIDDRLVTPAEINAYIKYLDKAHALLQKKGFSKAWYGTVFIRCEKCGGSNQYGAELGVGGNYSIGKDTVQVYSRPSGFIVELMVHELGHRYWFKSMSSTQREKFRDLVHIDPPKPKYDPRIVDPAVVDTAKGLVDEAFVPVRKLLKEFGTSRLKWWPDILKKFEDPIYQAAFKASQDMITAMQKTDSWVSDDPEVVQLHKDALEAGRGVWRAASDMPDSIKSAVNATPEPSEAPADLDKYGLEIFKPIRNRWVEDFEQTIEMAIATAYIYLDGSVAAHNAKEQTVLKLLNQTWEEQKQHAKDKVLPVSSYGAKHIDEAWAEAFTHYVLGDPMNRDQLESFRSVLASANVVERYKLALKLTPESVEKWRKELRVMTKIYKSIGLDGTERDLDQWNEAEKLFRNYKVNFTDWVYKTVLPLVSKGKETWVQKDIQKATWDAQYTIDAGSFLFPTQWDGVNSSKTVYIPNFSKLRHERERNIKRYQVAFVKVFKLLDDFLKDGLERYEDVTFEVAGMSVTIPSYGRGHEDGDAIDGYLRQLRSFVAPVERAGFKNTVRGLKVTLDFGFEFKDGGITQASYNSPNDLMTVYSLGGDSVSGTFAHELGHRFWFKELPGRARAHWEEVMSSQGVKIEREDVEAFFKFKLGLRRSGNVAWGEEFPQGREMLAEIEKLNMDLVQKAKFRYLAKGPDRTIGADFDPDYYHGFLKSYIGDAVLLEDISDYAASGGPVEAFAEVFRIYVIDGPGKLGPFTRELFKRVCGAGGVRLAAKSVANAFLATA